MAKLKSQPWEHVEDLATRKLDRELTPSERSAIRNAASLTVLDPVADFIRRNDDTHAIATTLHNLASSFEAHLRDARKMLVSQVHSLLERDLEPDEVSTLHSVATIDQTIKIMDMLDKTEFEAREDIFEMILDGLR